jgi:glucose-1-phosphatase
MYRTLIFDLGNVLIPFAFDRGYRRMEEISGRSVAEIRRRLGATDLVTRFESGAVEPEEFVRELSGVLDWPFGYDRFCQIWSSIFLPEPFIPETMLEALHRNYRLVLLSNTNAIHYAMLRETYPLLGRFDAYVLSHEVKAMKPCARIYQAALAKAQCAPAECFYTDDVREYVEAARGFGIDAVQFTSRTQLEGELRSRGIAW